MAKQKKAETVKPDVRTIGIAKRNINPLFWIGIILVLTFVCFSPLLSDQKEFTNWDDPGYVTDQPLVKSLSAENIKKIFAPGSIVMFNYHPVTVLSLAIDYQKGFDAETNTLSITPFATTNLFLHLLNTALVFIFLYSLSRKKIWVAGISALLFGIHPMHVESVAWISGRKDLLYCCFFLLSCITYVKYLEKNKKLMLLVSFLLFVLSCLSKAMAIPLPFVLLLIDFLCKRKFTFKLIAEKLPFLFISFIVGYYAIAAQKGVIGEHGLLTLWQRINYASYGFYMYWVKLFIPLRLSAFYPYPFHNGDNDSFIYLISPVIALVLLLFPLLIYTRKRDAFFSRELLWGMGFYLLMIAMVLQLVSVGQVIIAERYSYVSYVGPLFIISVFTERFFSNDKYRKTAVITVVFVTLLLAAITYQRTQVWQNSKTLWTDVIEKNKSVKANVSNLKTPYKNLAEYYTGIKEYDSAFAYYNLLTNAGTNDAEVWSNLGNIYALKNDMQSALNAYNKSIQLKPTDYETFMKRGVVLGKLDRNAESIKDFDKVIVLNPSFEDAYIMKLRLMLKVEQYEAVVKECNALVNRFPSNVDFWFLRGAALINFNRFEDGIKDFQRAIQLNPKAAGLYYYNIASAYAKMGQNPAALKNAQQARQLGFPVSEEFIQKVSK